ARPIQPAGRIGPSQFGPLIRFFVARVAPRSASREVAPVAMEAMPDNDAAATTKKPASPPPASYGAKDITVLEGLDPVRKRPGMYIGSTGPSGLHHLVWELFDNSVDEAMNGHADQIEVTLHKDGSSVTVSDNGRGIPVDNHPTHKKPAVEIILCTLHAGGKFDNSSAGNYKTSG